MRILFVSPNIYPDVVGGAEIFNYYFSQSLRDAGNDVTIITYSDSKLPGISFKKIKKTKAQRIITNLLIFSKIISIKPKPEMIILTYTKKSWMNWIIYPFLNFFFSIPYAIIIHGGSFHVWRPKFIYRFVFNNAKSIFGVSDRACAEYEKRSKREVHYLPPLIPFSKSSKKRSELLSEFSLTDKSYILYVGSIKEIKGTSILVKAFLNLEDKFVEENSLHLLIAGDGVQRRELEELANKSSLAKHVSFLGNVKRELVPGLFKLCDYYVIPSQFENLSISLLESMYNQKAIIGANSPGIADVLMDKKDALLFPTDNIEELKAKIIELVLDKALAEKLAKNAFTKYTGDYSYQKMIDKFLKIIT